MDLLKSFLTKEGLTVAELRQELARRRDVAISRALGLEMVSCLLEMVGHGMARARRAREPPPCPRVAHAVSGLCGGRILLEISEAFGEAHFLHGCEGCDPALQSGLQVGMTDAGDLPPPILTLKCAGVLL